MKRTFPGYYRPSLEEFDVLWAEALFVFDANVFLSIYGYSKRTRDVLLRLLHSARDRVWMPHQFAKEYQRNRVKAIFEQAEHYRSIRASLLKVLEHFKSPHRHPFIGKTSLASFERLCKELEKGERQHEALLTNDQYFRAVSELLDGRVGPAPAAAEIALMQEEARRRYALSVPPGFADAGKKPEPDSFGDYIGWRQILDYGKASQRSVILVTNDQKRDWWSFHGTRRIGPRPELVAEYLELTEHKFYMYSLDQFMQRARVYLGQAVTSATLQEVRERTEAPTEPRMKSALSVAFEIVEADPKPTGNKPDLGKESDPEMSAENAAKAESPSKLR